MELLRYMSAGQPPRDRLRDGHDAAVPYLHFLEGMMSLGPYRVPDSGRRMPANPRRGAGARREVSNWARATIAALRSWCSTTASSPTGIGRLQQQAARAVDKRDLFNVLYGVPPMFMFKPAVFLKPIKRGSCRVYQNTCPLVRQVATAENDDHRFLTPDRNVQQTRFANGIVVTGELRRGRLYDARRRNGRPDAIPCVWVELSRLTHRSFQKGNDCPAGHAHRQSARGLSGGLTPVAAICPRPGSTKTTSRVTPGRASGVRSIARRTVPSF